MQGIEVVTAALFKEAAKGNVKAFNTLRDTIGQAVVQKVMIAEVDADDIAECISLATGSDDVYVNIVADHVCVSARGAKSDGITDVTSLHGEFIENSKLRAEVEAKLG